jgi:hypothetical protein
MAKSRPAVQVGYHRQAVVVSSGLEVLSSHARFNPIAPDEFTQQTAGLHGTVVKVCKSDREGTVAGARGNGEVALIPDLPALTTEPGGSIESGHSLCPWHQFTW